MENTSTPIDGSTIGKEPQECEKTDTKKDKKALLDYLSQMMHITGKAYTVSKEVLKLMALASVIGVCGYGYYTFKQFCKKTPEEAHQDTIKIVKKVSEEVKAITAPKEPEKPIQQKVSDVAGDLAVMGAKDGSAIREWFLRTIQSK